MSDRLIREIPLIARYTRHNEDADRRFRVFIKGSLGLSNVELDAIVREETDRVWKQIDCTTCGNCCRTLQIVVDDRDIKRLAIRLGVSVQEFSRRYVRSDPKDATKFFASSPCRFLSDDNRCTVYEDRPQACRDFPYLHDRNFRSRSLAMLDNLAVCPIVFNVWQALKSRLWRKV